MIKASPLLARTAIAFSFLFATVYVLTFIDARLINGVSVWEKPSKFFLSLAIHMATLAWGLSLLPQMQQRGLSIRIASLAFVAAATFELTYMMFQAALGEASHFNVGDPVHALLYAMMGTGALTLTTVTGYLGWRILRSGNSVLTVAAGWSFLISAITTTLVAGYLSSGTSCNTSRWVASRMTLGAIPASQASIQRNTCTHQRSPGCRPRKRNSGRGVMRSLPHSIWWFRNPTVSLAQITWLPASCSSVWQQPSR